MYHKKMKRAELVYFFFTIVQLQLLRKLTWEYDPTSVKQLCDKLDFVNISNVDIF